MSDEMLERWSSETLKHYLETQISDKDRLYQTQFESAEKLTNLALSAAKEAVSVANTANEQRMAGMNEWRATYGDMTKNLVTRTEHESLSEKLNEIGRRVDTFISAYTASQGTMGESRQQKNTSTQMFIVAAGVILATVLSLVSIFRPVSQIQPVAQYVPAPVAPMQQNAPLTIPTH